MAPQHPIVSGPGDGERLVRANRAVTLRVDLPQLSVHELEFDPTFEVAQHTHDHVDAVYVLDGRIECESESGAVRAGRGTIVATPAGVPHGLRNPGPGSARVLLIHAPDGGFADLVRATVPDTPKEQT